MSTPLTIAVVGRKGGSGKTTTTINLGGALAERGLRVALMDLDPQASLTRLILGGALSTQGVGGSILEQRSLDALVRPTAITGVDLYPGDRSIESAALALADNPTGALRLRKLLRPIVGYDIILIDTPPSLGFAINSALLAAAIAIVPTALVQQDLDALQDTFDVRTELDELGAARIVAIVPNAVRPYRHDTAVIAALREGWGDLVAEPVPLSESVKVALNQALPVVAQDPQGAAARAYRALAARVVTESPAYA
jgi:chromosome partitioning protein